MKRFAISVMVTLLLGFVSTVSHAASPFYQGRTLRITVGFSPGGGFDLWARVFARHLGKYIPGNPTVIVENITGAGGLIQLNQLYKAVKPDGLTVGHIAGGLILGQMMGQPGYDFDPQKLIYIGAANKENAVFVLGRKSGATSIDKWRTSPVPLKIGGLATGNFADNMARFMKDVFEFPTRIVTGYKGANDILMAMEIGELAGSALNWDNVKTNRKRALEEGEVTIVLQCTAKPLEGLPKIPRMIDLAKTDEQKKLVQVAAHYANDYSRPFAVPPGTPNDRVATLRQAFQETLKDHDFLAEVEKMQMTLDPTTGDELTVAVANSAKLNSETNAKLKDILFKYEGW